MDGGGIRYDEAELQARLAGPLGTALGHSVAISGVEKFPSGFSWATYGFQAVGRTDGDSRALVLRLGLGNGLLAPYTTRPEALALEAFSSASAVPVPGLLLASDDPALLGAPFLVCDRVLGEVPLPWKGARTVGEAAHLLPIAEQFVRILADIHRHDWRRSALNAIAADTPAAIGTVAQVDRWAEMIARHSGAPVPILRLAERLLRSGVPDGRPTTVVHGDYRVGNYLQHDGQISAILDWELVHLGDPLEDLGWAYLKMFRAGSDRVCGLVGEDAFHAIYEQAGGVQVDRRAVRYFELLALYKIAAMNLAAMALVESGRATDLRLATMGFGFPGILLEIQRVVEDLW